MRGERTDIFYIRKSTLEAHLPFLDAQWVGGCRNGAELWRRLKRVAFEAPCASSENGRHGAGVPGRLPIDNCTKCQPPERSREL
jgi:hypothetical protein